MADAAVCHHRNLRQQPFRKRKQGENSRKEKMSVPGNVSRHVFETLCRIILTKDNKIYKSGFCLISDQLHHIRYKQNQTKCLIVVLTMHH